VSVLNAFVLPNTDGDVISLPNIDGLFAYVAFDGGLVACEIFSSLIVVVFDRENEGCLSGVGDFFALSVSEADVES